ncbi:transglutaminase family protein [Xanthobacter sp. TB0139]|uniref:transglutaminase family protein n=1 Tax=Xanthobacter sp. TB0139 TaxID=3459178 RepID=UPI00403A6041
MRVRIRHEITQHFEPGSRNMAAIARLTPRSCESQFIQRWTLDVDADCCLHTQEDAFGNLCHAFTIDGPTDNLTIIAEGEVETQDTSGIVRGTVERQPLSLYLRQTELTQPDAAIISFAEKLSRSKEDPLADLHALMAAVHDSVKEDTRTVNGHTLDAASALEKGAACSGSITHLFTSTARHLGLPARHVSGYFRTDDKGAVRHWAEAHVPEIGWIAFDCGQKICPTENHIRLSIGLDALAVLPLRSVGEEIEEQVIIQNGRKPRCHPRCHQSQEDLSNPRVEAPDTVDMAHARNQSQSQQQS